MQCIECERPAKTRGLCNSHYVLRLRRGQEMPPPMRATAAHCSVDGCDKPGPYRRGMCAMHRQRVRAHGSTDAPRRLTVDERFDASWVLDPETGCHIWQRGHDGGGYGTFTVTTKQPVRAHVYAWQRANGPVPVGLVLDHFVCDNPPCCNPEHLRPTTSRDNTFRSGRSVAAINEAKTHCVNGHPFDEENTYVPPRGGRQCRQCVRDRRARNGSRPAA